MLFTRCTTTDVLQAIEKANAAGGYELSFDFTSQRGASFRGRIVPVSSHVKGARRSASGRRICAACWHAHRDVLAALFDAVPAAKVSTAMAVYLGQLGFERQFPKTYWTNVGSESMPATYGQLCDCEE